MFLDYDRIELFDEEHSFTEDRYNTIGSIIGDISDDPVKMVAAREDIVFVVYTERIRSLKDGKEIDVIRLISARMATNFERGYIMEKSIDHVISIDRKFTEKELRQLEIARKMPISYDEDCPETTPERALRFRRVNKPRKAAEV